MALTLDVVLMAIGGLSFLSLVVSVCAFRLALGAKIDVEASKRATHQVVPIPVAADGRASKIKSPSSLSSLYDEIAAASPKDLA